MFPIQYSDGNTDRVIDKFQEIEILKVLASDKVHCYCKNTDEYFIVTSGIIQLFTVEA